ncbi:MAG: glutamate-ammonia-ligase adenylyltransferase [Deltaproteobacteria bacterium]|nr:glutamate-ammonia-ligase adenylyltransferase [Deltaproteobacteria bacterium]
MKPTLDMLKAACPEVDQRLLNAHLSRLSNRYFDRFATHQVCEHMKGLSRISTEHPVEVLLDAKGDGNVDCTVLAFDYPYLFSLITGVLAGMGFNIVSGDVFTYERALDKPLTDVRRRKLTSRRTVQDPLKRRRIIDFFSGQLETPRAPETWADDLKKNMEDVISLLERGDSESVTDAKHRVNEMVVKRLADLHMDSHPVLFPVQIEFDNESGPYTRLKIVSEDTPAFLYTLTNALSLQGISIEHVSIRTIHGRVEDEIEVVDVRGKKIEDPNVLSRVKLSVLLTKQFTYFLGKAPDPYVALHRFEQLVGDVLRLPERGQWMDLLSNPHALQDLARLLGTSDFLWEDFIRLQYETLLPMLKPFLEGHRFSEPVDQLSQRLRNALKGINKLEEQRRRLNEFKDREIFLIDLDHILNPETDFRVLARRLTVLAENVVNMAAELAYAHMVKRFGRPRTAADLEATFAILGLGKMGGAALGYASDIELLFVYSDNGSTDGEESIENAEFFDRLVRNTTQFIQAKREGIFNVDLRLRPYGNNGPLACSLENFCRYYGPEGSAHSYERLALVRLRAIGGDKNLAARVERIRDQMIYASRNINLKELRELRNKQFKEKTEAGKLNAKFSPGGLVDLEYAVQILQVMYGKDVPQLRTPRIHEALTALTVAGVLSPVETEQLTAAYGFLRRLINGMRMLRGSAKDLFLPPIDSDEFAHLARRMEYKGGGALDPTGQLHMDVETHMATVRAFVERHFGRDSLPGSATGTVADLVLSDRVPHDLRHQILSGAGFKNPARAYVNLRALAGDESRRQTFARLALLAFDILLRTPDPDMALNNWERYIRALPSPEFHYNILLSQPMRLEILLSVLSGSQFLADTLVRNPGFLDWVTIPKNLHQIQGRKNLEDELRMASEGCNNHKVWLNKLRRFRRREMLRIGTRDIYLGVSTEDVMLELSTLAEALTQVVLERVWATLKEEQETAQEVETLANHFCILAFGKLGGSELNYSSDIDLLGIYDAPATSLEPKNAAHTFLQKRFARVMESVRADLSMHTDEGYAYRVDLRLRPYGGAGELVPSVSALIDYYRNVASLWEIQAALKIRPVAGHLQIGDHFLEKIRPVLLQRRKREAIVHAIEKMRKAAIKTCSRRNRPIRDVKSGMGGLRDVEFLVQGLQLIHGPDHPGLLERNTLNALEGLQKTDILPEPVAAQLREDYVFLRRVEHYLQILEDRQIHALPKDPDELTALAKRVLGAEGNASHFMEQLEGCLKRIRAAYISYLVESK